jgi:hypothetical protein
VRKTKNKNKNLIFIVLIFFIGISFGIARSSDPEKILEIYSQDQVQEKFGETRFFEWIDEFKVKKDGIYFLTEKRQYLTYINEDGSLYFSGVKSRYDYNREQISWFFIWVFLISGGIVLIVILSSVKWYGFKWYKRLHER